MKKDNFSKKVYSEEAIAAMDAVSSDSVYDGDVYRFVWHSENEPVSEDDFLPYFIEKGNSSFEMQNKIVSSGSVGAFGVSFFDSLDNLLNCKTLYHKAKNKEHAIVKGKLDKNVGSCSNVEKNGHIDLFVYDPEKDNQFRNCFDIIKEDE